jgi:type 1 glutamine amidotransferase
MKPHHLLFALALLAGCITGCQKSVSVLVVVGGHDYDTMEFFDAFRSLEHVEIDSVCHPEAIELLQSSNTEAYDVLVYYDFMPGLPKKDSAVFNNLTLQGKPMLFLHHALGTCQDWNGYMEMLGGRYNMPGYITDSTLLSDYRHDIDMEIEVVDPDHPVTLGLKNFSIHDEGYSNITTLQGITPLLRTDHPDCAPLVGWTHQQDQSTIVYLMLGHDKHAYENPAFIQLLNQSIHWLAEQ